MTAKPPKHRLDERCVIEGIAPDLSRARALIMAGEIYVNGTQRDKSGEKVESLHVVEHKNKRKRFVSRAGDKLDAALKYWQLSLSGKTCIDLGASTGGFTDCLLQHDVKGVIAIDVGKHLLHCKLRQHPRVVNIEAFNARHITDRDLVSMLANRSWRPIEIIVADLSFISATTVLQAAVVAIQSYNMKQCVLSSDEMQYSADQQLDAVILIKPQFEATKLELSQDADRGVIRDTCTREKIVVRTIEEITKQGCRLMGRRPSSVPGTKGNIEELAWFRFNY